ncbi:MAG: hypothetical protein K0Q95_3100 [Bacteroidota bacterium]|nr:hypothetical protein [Bacteroidota bacterium]
MAADSVSTDSMTIEYKTFPFLFTETIRHKDANRVKTDISGVANPFSYEIESKNDDIFKMDGLNKSGSISRGITFGNNQDVVVNSNLNLQLSGHLSNDVDILMAATDNNIPIQPDGNTQQLQEFDKVFIQLSKGNTKLIAGDFQLLRPASYFMNFNKKAQGINFSTALKTNEEKEKAKQGIYSTSISAAVSRGKFARNQIQGIESNQGPYRLRGAESEPFIIVLSGTEKVFIDGRLVERGQENDYVINYNTAEITFTARQLITKDKRIVVEFQYSDKNYARSLVHFGNDYEQGKLRLHVNVYSEQDSKNQPLQQELTADQKKLLSRIGDTLSLAVSPSFDSVPFSNEEVLYQKKDSLYGGYVFPNVFVYSTNSDSAHFRVTFSNVGVGKGNYNQVSSDANGKVFEWVMPDTLTGQRRGSYEPVIQLVTPRKKQMLTVGAEYAFSRNSKLTVEGAASNNDINTFSKANSEDDTGYGLKLNFDNSIPLFKLIPNDTLQEGFRLNTNVNYEYVQKYFSPIERYRSVEFERDWNRASSALSDDQHIAGLAVSVSKKNLGLLGYRFNAFMEGNAYNATKHISNINVVKKGFRFSYDGSLLNSSSKTNTNFYRHKSGISQTIKWFTFGVRDEFEQNKFALTRKDSLLSNSYQFWEWEGYVQNSDTTKNRYGLNYKQRSDHAIKNISGATRLTEAAFAESYGGFLDLIQNPNSQLKLNAAYRRLYIRDPLLTIQKPDNTLVSRIEYDFRLLKGLVYSNTFYEIGSGLEVKKEFSYIEVAAGQGVYTWIDYNSNGIKELNEFEIAVYADQATYIKVYTPTDKYIKTYTNQFSQVLSIKPSAIWSGKKGIRNFVARFADQISYRVDRKSTEDDLVKAYNPFLAETNDSTLVTINSAFRNTFFINQMSPVFGLDITYQDIRNKSLLVSGFDTRANIYKEAKLRWNFTQQLSLNLEYKDGVKKSSSQYFPVRNFRITYFEGTPKLNYQPNTAFRLTVLFRYTDKKNADDLGGQHAVLQDYGAEIKYNVLNKGSLNLKGDFIQIQYNDLQSSALSFEMLDALKPGQNITWGASYQRNLSNNLQLSITYDGRKSEGNKSVHIGGAQVRAYF